eukprot:gene14199-20169_t
MDPDCPDEVRSGAMEAVSNFCCVEGHSKLTDARTTEIMSCLVQTLRSPSPSLSRWSAALLNLLISKDEGRVQEVLLCGLDSSLAHVLNAGAARPTSSCPHRNAYDEDMARGEGHASACPPHDAYDEDMARGDGHASPCPPHSAYDEDIWCAQEQAAWLVARLFTKPHNASLLAAHGILRPLLLLLQADMQGPPPSPYGQGAAANSLGGGATPGSVGESRTEGSSGLFSQELGDSSHEGEVDLSASLAGAAASLALQMLSR